MNFWTLGRCCLVELVVHRRSSEIGPWFATSPVKGVVLLLRRVLSGVGVGAGRARKKATHAAIGGADRKSRTRPRLSRTTAATLLGGPEPALVPRGPSDRQDVYFATTPASRTRVRAVEPVRSSPAGSSVIMAPSICLPCRRPLSDVLRVRAARRRFWRRPRRRRSNTIAGERLCSGCPGPPPQRERTTPARSAIDAASLYGGERRTWFGVTNSAFGGFLSRSA